MQPAVAPARRAQAFSAFGNVHAFAGRRLDERTGLYYYRHRYYDPRSGGFLSRDPSGSLRGPNLYAYTRNNPVNRLDPLGLDDQKAECIECRLKVVYQGWSWLSLVTKARPYTESSIDQIIPPAIERGYVQELVLKRIELQARVNRETAPCCCSAEVEGTISAAKEMPDLSTGRLNLVAAALALLSQFTTNLESGIRNKKLPRIKQVPKILGPFTVAALIHLFGLGAIEFEIKRSAHTQTRKQKLDCSWQTIVTDFNLGTIPTTRAVVGEVSLGRKQVCSITRIVGAY